MPELDVLRVFCDEQGRYGNPLGVVLDGPAVPATRRQELAAELGFSETVFVDDPATGHLRIFTPACELPLAGHPLVGTAWLLARAGQDLSELNPPAGPVATWVRGDQTWIRGPLWAAPPWRLHEMPDAAVVESMRKPPKAGQDADQYWAWVDRSRGIVRARVFAARYDVPEDEACGSASMLLADRLQTSLTVFHGEGSVVYASPGPDGTGEVGGHVVLDHSRVVR
ncbi:PhzF family phenazine biosynthesis protein [Kribbella deserti]|uniref:PhzF family phenazine biosynthesis protein n=1 Tax=Kribbella deserti TaxID=1926257 RepID=A0ABV6QF29_9ACTN